MTTANILLRTIRIMSLKIRRLRIAMSGRPANDLSYKQQRILETAHRFHCGIFLETGTFLGDTVAVMKYYFDTVLSVELSEELYEHNRERFRNCRNVKLWCGNSGALMPEMLHNLGEQRTLFWLDAHFSGAGTAGEATTCPIFSELAAIAGITRKDHCILIDDARCLTGTHGYPSVGEVKEMLSIINPSFIITIENDCITALPPEKNNRAEGCLTKAGKDTGNAA